MPKKTKKEVIIGIRVTKAFKAQLEKLAEKEGLTLTTFVRRLLLTHPEMEEVEND